MLMIERSKEVNELLGAFLTEQR
jgi:hypothetical protein